MNVTSGVELGTPGMGCPKLRPVTLKAVPPAAGAALVMPVMSGVAYRIGTATPEGCSLNCVRDVCSASVNGVGSPLVSV